MSTGNGRILVVEDEEAVRAITRRSLERAGFDVVAVEDGAHCRAALQDAGDLDAALIDITLPDESGVAVGRAVHQHDTRIAILFTSGLHADDVGLPADFPHAGMLEKPFSPQQLVQTMQDLIGKR